MIKNLKKAFTIIELVIVIAVIAILAAVMIPTYSSLVKKANLSADEQAVKQMNTALAIYTAENGKPSNGVEVKFGLSENDINADTMEPVTQGYAFYWDKDENKIVLVGEGKAKAESDWVLLTSNGYGKAPEEDVKDADSLQNAINESSTNEPVLIKLSNNLEINKNVNISDGKSVIIDLNGKTLDSDYLELQNTNTSKYTIIVEGGSLTIKNGEIITNGKTVTNRRGSLVLDRVNIKNETFSKGAIIGVEGISNTSIIGCNITYHSHYGIGTDNSEEAKRGARISIVNSKILPSERIDAGNGNRQFCGINITINSTISIEGCEIAGQSYGIYFRGCNATIKNSSIYNTNDDDGISAGASNNKWGSGTMGSSADIVFACGGEGFGSYLSTTNYVCENVKGAPEDLGLIYSNFNVYVHQPKGGKVNVSGDITVTKTFTEQAFIPVA